MTPAEASRRMTICELCRQKCAAWHERKIAAIYGECALGKWEAGAPGLTRSSADEHEREAAQAGYVPSCCGSAANTKLAG